MSRIGVVAYQPSWQPLIGGCIDAPAVSRRAFAGVVDLALQCLREQSDGRLERLLLEVAVDAIDDSTPLVGVLLLDGFDDGAFEHGDAQALDLPARTRAATLALAADADPALCGDAAYARHVCAGDVSASDDLRLAVMLGNPYALADLAELRYSERDVDAYVDLARRATRAGHRHAALHLIARIVEQPAAFAPHRDALVPAALELAAIGETNGLLDAALQSEDCRPLLYVAAAHGNLQAMTVLAHDERFGADADRRLRMAPLEAATQETSAAARDLLREALVRTLERRLRRNA